MEPLAPSRTKALPDLSNSAEAIEDDYSEVQGDAT